MSRYIAPTTLDEALRARREHPDFILLAGGTDLLVGARHREEPPGIIDLFGLPPLVGVREDPDGTIVVGAATTFFQLATNQLVGRELPCLAAAAREVGALQIQSRGTIGGNVGTSSPVGDSLPVLMALDAEIEVASQLGERIIPYHSFCTGYRKIALAADELIVAIRFPPRPAGLVQYWRKVGTRQAQSISKVAVAATATLAEGRIDHVRIGLGAVAERPIRARKVEAALAGQPPSGELAERAKQVLAEEITPIDDVRSTAAYRMVAAQNVVARFIINLAARDRE